MDLETRLIRIENAIYELRKSTAKNQEELERIEKERTDQEYRDWEEYMGEDL